MGSWFFFVFLFFSDEGHLNISNVIRGPYTIIKLNSSLLGAGAIA